MSLSIAINRFGLGARPDELVHSDSQAWLVTQLLSYDPKKPWWFTTDAGKLALSVRYGTKVLELAKGKVAVEVGSEKDLVPTLELIKTAVLNGELDTQIEAAANKLRDGFAQ